MKNPINKHNGQPLSEYLTLDGARYELEVDRISLWQEILTGKDSFGLFDSKLDEFLRLVIVYALEAGAVVVRFEKVGEKKWKTIVLTHYGTEPEQIADCIVKEWRDSDVDENQRDLGPELSPINLMLPEKIEND